jgi:hypothetical protein
MMNWYQLLSTHQTLTQILAVGFVVSEILSFLPAEITQVSGVLQGLYILYQKIRNKLKN